MVKAGFSRDTSNSIKNFNTLIVLFLSFKITPLITKYGTLNSLRSAYFIQCLIYSFNIAVFSQNILVYAITQFLSQLMMTTGTMTIYMFLYSFPIHGFTGMFATLMISVWNFSTLTSVNTLIINEFGWRRCAAIGVFIQACYILSISRLITWIEAGSVELDTDLKDE